MSMKFEQTSKSWYVGISEFEHGIKVDGVNIPILTVCGTLEFHLI